MDGIYVFLGAGAGIGGIVGLALMAPVIVPRVLSGNSRKFDKGDAQRLSATVPIHAKLDAAQRQRLEKQAARFFKEKRFMSDGGEIPPIMRAAVAGHACMLRLHPQADCYPEISSVFIGDPGSKTPSGQITLGWDDVRESMDGGACNPMVRRFAQQLRSAGTNPARSPTALAYPEKWEREFKAAAAEIKPAESSLLSAYGEDAKADFFLTACEAYFQRGPELAQQHPRVHGLLREYFAVDSNAA